MEFDPIKFLEDNGVLNETATLTSDELDWYKRRFPIKHGPFNSTRELLWWLKKVARIRIYRGTGKQEHMLKTSGGGQQAWVGFLERNSDNKLWFWGNKKYPFDPVKDGAKTGEESGHVGPPLNYPELINMQNSGMQLDDILAAAIERSIKRSVAKILANPNSREYLALDETLSFMLAELFEIEQGSDDEVVAKPQRTMTKYGVDENDFIAAAMQNPSEVADIFGLTASQTQTLFRLCGLVNARVDYKLIEKLYNEGRSAEEIAPQVGVSVSTVKQFLSSLRASTVEELHKQGVSPLIIANQVGMDKRKVRAIITMYNNRISSMPWCKKHGMPYVEKFGCHKCEDES